MGYVGHIYNMPHMPLQLVTIFKMVTYHSLPQKMCMDKNGFNTTTVWSVGNSEAFKEYTHRVGVCHPNRCTHANVWLIRCVHAIFDVVMKCIATVSLRFMPSLKGTTNISTKWSRTGSLLCGDDDLANLWHSLTHPLLLKESHFTSYVYITAEEGPKRSVTQWS